MCCLTVLRVSYLFAFAPSLRPNRPASKRVAAAGGAVGLGEVMSGSSKRKLPERAPVPLKLLVEVDYSWSRIDLVKSVQLMRRSLNQREVASANNAARDL